MAGDPFADATPQIMQAMADAGADVIEVGVPFSDPMADGPVIQQAGERALTRAHRAAPGARRWCAASAPATTARRSC